MEQQIQDLVASIRKEGIETAKAEAERIIAEAKSQAEAVVRDAESEKAKLLSDARKEIELEKNSAEASIRQAARNASLSLKKSIEDEFTRILRDGAGKAMHGDALLSLIKSAVSADAAGKAIELPKADIDALRSSISSVFASEIAAGMEFRPSSSLSAGFRIAEKDGSGYVGYSDEECAKLLFPYLSESLREIL